MDKRVLIIGPDFFDKNESVEKAFMKKGWDTKVIGYGEDRPLAERFIRHVGIDSIEKKRLNGFNSMVVEEYTNFKPQLVFIIKGGALSRETLETMRASKRILWMMDSIFRVPETMANIDLFDYIFSYERSDVERLEKQNIKSYFLAVAFDDSYYFPIDNVEKDIDIAFVGSLYAEKSEDREKLLDEIIANFPDRNIQIYGKYFCIKKPQRIIKYYFKGYNKYYMNHDVQTSEVNKLYSRSKIVINIHHKQTKYSANTRFFELMGSRTFQIVDETGYIKDEFIPDETVVCYRSKEELMEKIKMYLNNKELRERVAQNAYNEAINKHTYVNRMDYVLDVIGEE